MNMKTTKEKSPLTPFDLEPSIYKKNILIKMLQ